MDLDLSEAYTPVSPITVRLNLTNMDLDQYPDIDQLFYQPLNLTNMDLDWIEFSNVY